MVFNPFENYNAPGSVYERISLARPTNTLVPIDYNMNKDDTPEEKTVKKLINDISNSGGIVLPNTSSGNPIEILKSIDWKKVPERLKEQFMEVASGASYLGNKGGLLGALNFTGKPITDAPWVQPGYAEKYLQPYIDNKLALAQQGVSGGFLRDASGRIRVDDTIQGRQARIAAGLDKYYDKYGNVRPRAEREALGINTLAGHYEQGSADGGTSAIGKDLTNLFNNEDKPEREGTVIQSTGRDIAEAYGDSNFLNDGGVIMPIYAQQGLIPQEAPMAMEQPGQPNMPLPMPQQAPMQPNMPSEPVSMPPMAPAPMTRKSFSEKVAEAKAFIESKSASMPATPMPMMEQPMMDGQGDGGVYGDVDYSMEELGPDIGPDTVDAKLTPGEAVIPAEAVEANPEVVNGLISQGREIQAMKKGGVAYNYEGGLISSTKAQKLFKKAGDNQELKNKIAYLKSGGMLNPNMMKALSIVEEDMYMQEGNASVDPRYGASVGQFLYETSINPSQASTALSDYGSLVADETAEAKKEAATGKKVKSTKIETYTKGVGGSIEYAYKYTYLFEDGTADVDYEDQSGNPLPGIPAGYTLSTETNPAQQDRTTWTKSIDVINRRNQEGLQAANNLKQRAGRVMNLIRNNRADLGNPGTRNSFFRKVVRTGVGLFQGVFDFGLNVDATQGTISQLEQELEAQSVDVLTQMKAKGATFGAMSNAEWEKIQNQIGTVDDTLGAIYARQASFVVLYDVLKKGVDAFNKWQAKQRQASDFSTPVSQFEIEYLDSPEHQASIDEANSKILEAIDYGKSINSGKDQSNKDTGSTKDTDDTGDIVTIYSQEEWDNLPDGTEYYDGNLNNNVVYVKGGV